MVTFSFFIKGQLAHMQQFQILIAAILDFFQTG